MVISNQDNICTRCHSRPKILETFKKCSYCSSKYCTQCWTEIQVSDDYKLLFDKPIKGNNINTKRICSTCIQKLHENSKLKHKESHNNNDDYQLALAISLSLNETEQITKQKRKLNDEKNTRNQKLHIKENNLHNNDKYLLKKTAEAIERFMNRAKSNCELNLIR